MCDLGKHDEAMAAVDRGLAGDPENYDALSARCNIQFERVDFTESIRTADLALKLWPKDANLHRQRGDALNRMNELPEALKEYQSAIAIDSKDAYSYGWCGVLFHALNELEEAAAALLKAEQLDPNNAYHPWRLSMVYVSQGKWQDVLDALHRALAVEPSDAVKAKLHANRARTLINLRKPEDALQAANEAIGLDRKIAAAHLYRGIALMMQRDYSEAAEALKEAEDLDGKNVKNLLALADAYFELNRWQDWADVLGRVLALGSLAPGMNAAVCQKRALALLNAGRFDDAVKAADEAIEIVGHANGKVHAIRGVALMRLRNFPDAVKALTKAAQLDKADPEIPAELGRALQRVGALSASNAAYLDAVNRGNKEPDVLDAVAWWFANRPDRTPEMLGRARDLIEAALAETDEGYLWSTCGCVRYRNGLWKDALEALQKAMERQNGAHSPAYDWFFVAMAHQKLGHADARKWYARAVTWTAEHDRNNEELAGFQREAAEVLGIPARPVAAPK